jgi:hypothetical protein
MKKTLSLSLSILITGALLVGCQSKEVKPTVSNNTPTTQTAVTNETTKQEAPKQETVAPQFPEMQKMIDNERKEFTDYTAKNNNTISEDFIATHPHQFVTSEVMFKYNTFDGISAGKPTVISNTEVEYTNIELKLGEEVKEVHDVKIQKQADGKFKIISDKKVK